MTIFDIIKYPITEEFRAEDLQRIPEPIINKWLSVLSVRNPKLSHFISTTIDLNLISGEYLDEDYNHRTFSDRQKNMAIDLLKRMLLENEN